MNIKMNMKDLKKFGDFHKVNEEHHLEGDYHAMKEYIEDALTWGPSKTDYIMGFLDTLDMDEVTVMYHQVERWNNQ